MRYLGRLFRLPAHNEHAQNGVARVGNVDQDAHVGERSVRYQGWAVVVTCFILAMWLWGLGLYGHGIYLLELEKWRSIDRSEASIAISAMFMLAATMAVFTNELISAIGVRALAFAGLICLAGSLVVLASAYSLLALSVSLLFMSFAWVGIGGVTIAVVISEWFEVRRGKAVALGLTGASFGGVAVVPSLSYCANAFGFGQGLVIMTMALLLSAGPMCWFWMRFPDHKRNASIRARNITSSVQTTSIYRSTLLKDTRFWLVTFPASSALLAQVGFLVHQLPFLASVLDRKNSVIAVTLTTTSAIVGRVVVALVADAHDPRRLFVLCAASQAVALTTLLFLRTPELVMLACGVYGFSVGNLVVLPILIVQRDYLNRNFATVAGLLTAVMTIASGVGPGAVGYLQRLSGDYILPFALCIILNCIACACMLIVSDRPSPHSG